MKSVLHKFYFLLLLSSLFACKKDFLEVAPTSALYRENYVKDLATLSEFLNGTYLQLSSAWAGNIESYAAYADLVADNLKPSGQLEPEVMSRYNWSQENIVNSNRNMSREWQNNYLVIRSASFVVQEVEKYSNQNEAKAANMKGQALTLRAMMHFKLVNIFAQSYKFTDEASHLGIPYITTSDISQAASRNTVKEVYDAIIKDLKEAIELMEPTGITDIRYMNKDAAKAFLARVYLFKSDYAQALDLAKEVCEAHPLMTQDQGYPNGLYHQKNPGETEALFQFPPTQEPSSYFIGVFFRDPVSWFYATNDLSDILRESSTDIRSTWVAANGDNWLIEKFPSGVAGGIGYLPSTDYYEPLIRSSEMFLTVAEAAAKTEDEETAREYLNAVRRRADLSAIDITTGGDELLNAIYKERRKELCFEHLRMYDLQRLKLGVHRADVFENAPTDLPYGDDKSIAPIPLKDIEIAGLEPNPGY